LPHLAALAGGLVLLVALSLATAAWADHQQVELVSTGPAGGNGAIDVNDFALSRDGGRAFFTTAERLVAGDTDDQVDLYERTAGSTTLVSTGPAGGNGPYDVQPYLYSGVSRDGSHVLFATKERLTADDTDDQLDVYEHSAGSTTLVSIGPAAGNGPFDSAGAQISQSGTTVVFMSSDRLTVDDTNSNPDLYLRAGSQVTLLSGGPVNEQYDYMTPIGISRDGQRIFFATTRQLSPSDTNLHEDVYKWEGGARTIESVGTNGENAGPTIYSEAIDADGRHLFFSTYGRLSPLDTDDSSDVYERAGGVTTLASIGPAGGNGPYLVGLVGVSADGSHVFFTTDERLVAADTDDYRDIYSRAGGVTTLVSAGPLGRNEDFQNTRFWSSSADGTRAFFTTFDQLTAEDTDGVQSAYEYSGGTAARWLAPAYSVGGNSADGSRVFLFTTYPLLPADTDANCYLEDPGCLDVYELQGDQKTLISTGPTDSGGDTSACRWFFAYRVTLSCPLSASEDGTRVLFWSNAKLVAGDTDSSYDVYLASTRSGPSRDDYRSATSFCRAERRFLGQKAFRKRYGRHPFRTCVVLNRRRR
jgi:hypothetical protein